MKLTTKIGIIVFSVILFACGNLYANDGSWQVRVRGLYVVPDESADISLIGGDVDIEEDTVPELDITYFFTENFGVELILGTTNHGVEAVNTAAGKVDLGEVSLLPPTLTVQYHFLPHERFRPYVGVGLNYTIFYNEDAPGGVVTDIDYDDSFGYALQAGIDIMVNDNWFVNLDVKKLFLNTDVSLNDGVITADVDIDPWIYGFGFGYRF